MRETKERAKPTFRSLIVTAGVTALIVVALLDGPVKELLAVFSVENSPAELTARLLLGAAAALWAGLAWQSDRNAAKDRIEEIAQASNMAGRYASEELDPDKIVDAAFESAVAIRERYFNETIGLFCSMLVDESYRIRVKEQITLERNSAIRRTRVEFAISAAEKELILRRTTQPLPQKADATTDCRSEIPARSAVMLVPLTQATKGTLLSDLEIRDSTGCLLSELTQPQRMGLTTIALAAYFAIAFDEVRAVEDSGDDGFASDILFNPDADARLWLLRKMALQPNRFSPTEAAKEFEQIVTPLKVRDSGARESLKSLCLYFADSYYMAAEVPVPEGFHVAVDMRSDFSVFVAKDSKAQRVRDFFGMEPPHYSIDVGLSRLTNNYHAELNGGERQQYVQKHHLVDNTLQIKVDDNYFKEGREGQVIYQSDPNRVSPRVNIRNFASRTRSKLSWEIFVEEIPPGTLAPVTTLSALSAAISFCFAFIVARASSDNFDAPALVVALPLFVVTFFGFSFEKMTRSSIVGVGLFSAASGLIVISATLVLLSGARPPGIVHGPELLGFWRIPEFSWMLLVCSLAQLVVTLNLGFLTYRRVQRHRAVTDQVYKSVGETSERPSDDQTPR